MKQGIQSSFPNIKIQKEGCYFLCLMQWASEVTGNQYTESNVEGYYDYYNKLGLLEKDCFVVNPVGLLNDLLSSTSLKSIRRGTDHPEYGYYVTYLKKPGYGHFVLGKDNNPRYWDPLDPSRPAAKDYAIDSYRVFS